MYLMNRNESCTIGGERASVTIHTSNPRRSHDDQSIRCHHDSYQNEMNRDEDSDEKSDAVDEA